MNNEYKVPIRDYEKYIGKISKIISGNSLMDCAHILCSVAIYVADATQSKENALEFLNLISEDIQLGKDMIKEKM
jgi:hypothetical protein